MSNLSKSVQECPITLAEILLEEPRLIKFMADSIEKMNGVPPTKRSRVWYKELKPIMLDLVGFGTDNKKLNKTEVYDLIYFFMIDLLKM